MGRLNLNIGTLQILFCEPQLAIFVLATGPLFPSDAAFSATLANALPPVLGGARRVVVLDDARGVASIGGAPVPLEHGVFSDHVLREVVQNGTALAVGLEPIGQTEPGAREVPATRVVRVDRGALLAVARVTTSVARALQLLAMAVAEALLVYLAAVASLDIANVKLEEAVVMCDDVNLNSDLAALLVRSDNLAVIVILASFNVLGVTEGVAAHAGVPPVMAVERSEGFPASGAGGALLRTHAAARDVALGARRIVGPEVYIGFRVDDGGLRVEAEFGERAALVGLCHDAVRMRRGDEREGEEEEEERGWRGHRGRDDTTEKRRQEKRRAEKTKADKRQDWLWGEGDR